MSAPAASNASPTTTPSISGGSPPVVNTNDVPWMSWSGVEDEIVKWEWILLPVAVVLVVVLVVLALHR